MATNAILTRPDGYGVTERSTDIIFYTPVAVADNFSAYLKPHGTESRDGSVAAWIIPKCNDAGVTLVGSIIQVDLKSAFKLTPAPIIPTSLPVPASLPTPLVSTPAFPAATPVDAPTGMLMVTVPAAAGDFQRTLIKAHEGRLFELVNYSEKAFALFTAEEFGKANTEAFLRVRGMYNPSLKHYLNGSSMKGWIFGKSNKDAKTMLEQLSGVDLTPYLNGVKEHDWSKSGNSNPPLGGPVITTLEAPYQAQLRAITADRTVPQVVSELLSMLSRTPEVAELEIPHIGGDMRKVIWGPGSEVETRYAAIQHDHPGIPITTEIVASVNTTRLMVLTWSDH